MTRRAMAWRPALLLSALALGGCSLAPHYARGQLPVPPSWPAGDPYRQADEAMMPQLGYRELFTDARLRQLIDQALANNRNLRVAAANVAAARAQLRITRSNQLPELDAGAGASVTDGSLSATGNSITRLTAQGSINAFELDLFGRLASLSRADQERLLATEAGARATRIALVGDIANAWIARAADKSLLAIAIQTEANAARSVTLTEARLRGGIAPRSDVAQARQVLETARADAAQQRTNVAQDENLLQLLVGAPIDPALLADSIDAAEPTIVLPRAGLDSAVLLKRPDIMQAEYLLRASNAQIGAARAALFPSISLTGIAGFASNALRSLFTGGAFGLSASASARYPIFAGGGARAGVAKAEASRDAALATYEGAIQTGFREVADALARAGTIEEQRRAVLANEAATADAYRLADARYRGGADPFLSSLDAQRQLYSAERNSVAIRRTQAINRIDLYRALGIDPAF